MRRIDKSLLLLGLTCFMINCGPHHSNDQIPPSDLLISNYHLADLVYVARVINIAASDTLFDDAGVPGYIRYRFETEPVKILKGHPENKSLLTFYSSAEYDAAYIPFWRSRKELLIFLKQTTGSPLLYAIEAGLIPYSDELDIKMEEILREIQGS
jgi:hypothetical protein